MFSHLVLETSHFYVIVFPGMNPAFFQLHDLDRYRRTHRGPGAADAGRSLATALDSR